MTSFIKTFADELKRRGLASWWTIKGCSELEIRRIEDEFDVKLPAEYRVFLREMGHRAGKFMKGTDIFYEHLFENRAAAEEALDQEGNPFDLTPKMFVFSSHQGYIFHLFDCDTHLADPPVYGFAEGESAIKQINNSFTDFLQRLLSEERQSWKP